MNECAVDIRAVYASSMPEPGMGRAPHHLGERQVRMPRELTDRQQAIFDFIATIIRGRGAPPTIREIMDQFDINATNGVRTRLGAPERKGHIRRHPRLSRG